MSYELYYPSKPTMTFFKVHYIRVDHSAPATLSAEFDTYNDAQLLADELHKRPHIRSTFITAECKCRKSLGCHNCRPLAGC